MKYRTSLWLVAAVAALVLAAVGTTNAWQQIQLKGAVQFGGSKDSEVNSVFLPTERTATRRLELGKKLLEDERYGEAVRILGAILESQEDYFFDPDGKRSSFRSLKSEARRLLGELPEAGRQSYNLQFGARAKKMLGEALGSGDTSKLAEVSRRFFHTDAGYEATLLLGRYQLDHGRPLAAALAFEQLLSVPQAKSRFEPALSVLTATCWTRAGMEDSARITLNALKKSHPDATVRFGQQTIALFDTQEDPIAWLTQQTGKPIELVQQALGDRWLMYRGDLSRNAESVGGTPLLAHRWDQRMAINHKLEDFIQRMQQAYLRQGVAALPSTHPLAIRHPYVVRNDASGKDELARDPKTGEPLYRDTIVMRSMLYIWGVDFETGKLLWQVEPPDDNDALKELVKSSWSSTDSGQVPQLASGLEQRMFDDAIYGTLSSDGERVFVIQDLDLSNANPYDRRMMFMRAQMQGGELENDNRLVALELAREGYRVWEVGGPDSQVEELVGAFFLGAPLPMGGRLYTLAEIKGSIELVVLDAKTGQLQWRQQLAVLERDINQDPYRRIAGATPSFSNGVLICPTSAGAAVAVDLTSRSLLWAYKYPQQYNNHALMRMRGYNTNQPRKNDRWLDGSITIANGHVLLTPLESDKIHCLNLIDGTPLWTQDRGENLFVGCVYEDKVLLVGAKQVTAIQLADGKQVGEKSGWPSAMLSLPDASMPSGRGYLSSGKYYLPVTNSVGGEVVTIDLAQGKVVNRTKSHDGRTLGNLICYRGEVISQGVDFLGTYYQVESLRSRVADALKANPDDANAIARLGEIELNEGNFGKAIEHFRRSYRLDPNDLTRELLVSALLEGVRRDFSANRDSVEELERLIDQPEQKVALLRMVADGQRVTGETMKSFESYLKLLDIDTIPHDETDLEDVDENHSVRRDRWIRAQLADLRAGATPEQQDKMDAAIEQRLAGLNADASLSDLRKSLRNFGNHPQSQRLRVLLVDKLLAAKTDRLECQMLITQLETSDAIEERGAAAARMSQLLHDAGRATHAAIYDRKLATEFANVVCRNGQTGAQLAAERHSGPQATAAELAHDPWPRGEVEVTTSSPSRSGRTALRRQYPLDIRGDQGAFFSNTQVSVDQQQQAIVGRDGYGAEIFSVPLNQPNQSRRSYIINPNLNYGKVHGHLLVVSMGYQIFGIDTLSSRPSSWESVLWRKDLTEQLPGVSIQRGINARRINVAGGLPRFRAEDPNGRAVGVLGPILPDGITFQRFREVVCTDPISGETLWIRRNIQQGSDLFGDAQHLFVVPPGSNKARVLRTLDGTELGTREVPSENDRMATHGRRVLTSNTDDGNFNVQLVDPWEEKVVWARQFDPTAKSWLIEGEALGVLEPSGKFVLLDIDTGEALIEQQLEPESLLTDIYMSVEEDRYLLFTNHPVESKEGESVSATPGGYNNPLVSGRIYAFDRASGEPLWPVPATIEQQGLLLPQPSRLPVLAFVQHVVRSEGSGRRRTKTSVLCLDKRTGRVIYEKDDFSFGTGYYQLSGDLEADRVSLTLPSLAIHMRYTDKPVAPEPPLQAGLEANGPAKGGGIFRIFGAMGRALGGGSVDDSDIEVEPAIEVIDDDD